MGPGDILGERFVILEHVAASATSVVFRGLDRDRGEQVAIKMLGAAHDLERFRREAQILRTLAHRNIARLVKYGIAADGSHWIAQQWLGGPTLRYAFDHGGLNTRAAVAMARQVARALGAAHTAGIVHRDIKPSNILANSRAGHDGVPGDGDGLDSWAVIDFGVARMISESTHLTHTGVVIGTLGYMAPEQARAERAIDARADVWAVGCVLYEALTGRPAFAADTLIALQAMLIAAEPPPVAALGAPGLPTMLSRVIDLCLHKDPSHRPDNGHSLAVLLEEVEERGLPDTAPKQATSRRVEPATSKVGPHNYISIVLVAAKPGQNEPQRAAWRDRAAAKLAPFGADPALLRDGSVVFVAPSTAKASSIVNAAHAALAVYSAFPDRTIGIATATDRGHLQSSLEQAGTVIQASALAQMFSEHGQVTRSGIRIDALTAAHLSREFTVTTEDDLSFLTGRKKV